MSAHTPGPWTARMLDDPQWVVASSGPLVCNTLHGNDEANARLIAAAPEMLDAARMAVKELEWFLSKAGPGSYSATGTLEQLRAAIAKAEGR